MLWCQSAKNNGLYNHQLKSALTYDNNARPSQTDRWTSWQHVLKWINYLLTNYKITYTLKLRRVNWPVVVCRTESRRRTTEVVSWLQRVSACCRQRRPVAVAPSVAAPSQRQTQLAIVASADICQTVTLINSGTEQFQQPSEHIHLPTFTTRAQGHCAVDDFFSAAAENLSIYWRPVHWEH